MKFRKIIIDKEVWEYFVKGGSVVFRPPSQKKFIVDIPTIIGGTWDTFERGQWKKTVDGMVMPHHIANYIRSLRGKNL